MAEAIQQLLGDMRRERRQQLRQHAKRAQQRVVVGSPHSSSARAITRFS